MEVVDKKSDARSGSVEDGPPKIRGTIIGTATDGTLIISPYIIQLTESIESNDQRDRERFTEFVIEHDIPLKSFQNKIIFSDEANFYIDGLVTKSNCRIWGSEMPHENKEQPNAILMQLLTVKVIVWCAYSSLGIIGPYFFENPQGNAAITTAGYNDMLQTFLWPELKGVDTNDMYFQQGNAAWHTDTTTISILSEKFDGRVISDNGDFNWPPRSSDLNPLDFFLWGYLKDKVYESKPKTIDELKASIRNAVDDIRADVRLNALNEWSERIKICKENNGAYLNDIKKK